MRAYRIAFGWSSVLVKEFTPQELNFPADKDTMYEVRQKYFHIAYIPMFPTSKIYVMRQGKNMYNTSAAIQESIKNRGPYRTPLYSFVFPIFLLVLMCFSLLVGTFT